MKKLFLSLLVIGIIFFAACAPTTTAPESRSPPTPEPIEEPTPVIEPTPKDIVPPEEEPKPEVALTTYTVGEWNGTGIKTTEPFSIEYAPWAIKWGHIPETIDGQSVGLFQIMIYDIDNPDFPLTLAANSLVEEEDTSWVYQTGTFYLTINAANTRWAIIIAAKK